jgi:hypothetical protein
MLRRWALRIASTLHVTDSFRKIARVWLLTVCGEMPSFEATCLLPRPRLSSTRIWCSRSVREVWSGPGAGGPAPRGVDDRPLDRLGRPLE